MAFQCRIVSATTDSLAEVKRGGLQRDALIPLALWTPALAYSKKGDQGASATSAQVPGNSENYVAWPVSAGRRAFQLGLAA
jgi:hypothetical protein